MVCTVSIICTVYSTNPVMANKMSLVVIGQASVGMQHVQWFQFEERHHLVKFSVYIYTVTCHCSSLNAAVFKTGNKGYVLNQCYVQ